MTREEAIRIIKEADGPHGNLVGPNLDWAQALVLSLELLGLMKFDDGDERKDDAV